MAEARQGRHTRDARLLGVELPRMEIHDGRLALAVDASDRAPREREREEPEPAATGDRPVPAGELDGTHRELPQPAVEPRCEARAAATSRPLSAATGRRHRLQA